MSRMENKSSRYYVKRYKIRKGSPADVVVSAGRVIGDNGAAAVLVVIGTAFLVRCLMMRG